MSSRMKQNHHHSRSLPGELHQARTNAVRPNVAYRQRGSLSRGRSSGFSVPETWHEPVGRSRIEYIAHPPGAGYVHPVSLADVQSRVAELPVEFTRGIEVIQFSAMTRKRSVLPLYGMQWGPNVYLYPMEASLVETYRRPPTPHQRIEAGMFGGEWSRVGNEWRLAWTPDTIRDFYLNNVLIHEIGHVNDQRNTNAAARERYANWFAIEYGYRFSRGRV